jgi:hypothetical protein
MRPVETSNPSWEAGNFLFLRKRSLKSTFEAKFCFLVENTIFQTGFGYWQGNFLCNFPEETWL